MGLNNMFRYDKTLLILLLNSMLAIAVDVDLSLALDIADTDNVEFGQIIPFSITVTNNGPDAAASTSTSTLPNRIFTNAFYENSNGFPNIIIFKDNSIKQDCIILTFIGEPPPPPLPPPPTLAFTIRLPMIPANTSVTCYIKAQVLFDSGNESISFRSVPILGDIDSDLSNNNKEIVFSIKPAVIPTLNKFTLLLLSCFLLVIGMRHFIKIK